MFKVLGLTPALIFSKIIFVHGTNVGELQMCLKDLLYELIIGNISKARAHNDPDETWYVKAATVIRAQIRLSTETKTLKIAEVTDQLAVTRKKLIQLQQEHLSLFKYTMEEILLVKNETFACCIFARIHRFIK